MGDAAFLDLIASTLFLKAAFEKSIEAIKSKIRGHQIIIERLEMRLSDAEEMEDKEDAEMEQVAVRPLIEDVKKASSQQGPHQVQQKLQGAQAACPRRLGHVVLSPPIGLNVGDEGYTEDWAVIEVDPSKVNKENFRGNFIDLGTSCCGCNRTCTAVGRTVRQLLDIGLLKDILQPLCISLYSI